MTTLCRLCQEGNHPHDRWPDGADGDCPNLAEGAKTKDDACTCLARLPYAEPPTKCRCECGNVHRYGDTSSLTTRRT